MIVFFVIATAMDGCIVGAAEQAPIKRVSMTTVVDKTLLVLKGEIMFTLYLDP